ncbi:MAG: hypothetical protein FJW95_02695 [Actinobacteria bacterium]|nr:hypothetical protein [Actinomycetota bacterium]
MAIDRPRPLPDEVSAFYWEAAGKGALAVLRCDECRRMHHPPDLACPHCGATALRPETVSGRGTVFAATVARQAFDRAFVDAVPFTLALVELDEQPGLKVLTNLVGTTELVAVGTPVELAIEPHGDWSLPQFRVVGS